MSKFDLAGVTARKLKSGEWRRAVRARKILFIGIFLENFIEEHKKVLKTFWGTQIFWIKKLERLNIVNYTDECIETITDVLTLNTIIEDGHIPCTNVLSYI